MKSTHFIVGHLWKLEIRHKSNLKKQQIIALIGIHRETFMKIERHKLELFEKKNYYIYEIYENNLHFEDTNTVETFY